MPRLASRRWRWLWEQVQLPYELSHSGVDTILCLGGYTVFAARIPQISVWQNSNAFPTAEVRRPWQKNFYSWVQRQIQTLSMKKAAQNIFLTQNSIDLATQWWDMQRYEHTYVYSGIRRDLLIDTTPPSLEQRPRVALTIGHAYFHKNYEALIDAMAEYRARYTDELRLEIVGGAYNGHYFDSLHQRIIRRGLSEHVTMSGPATAEEVTQKLRTAKVYIVTSLLETFGLTILEAMNAGVPVVASRATCHPEVCGDAALLCDPHDPHDIAEKLHILATNTEMQRHYQAKGLERVKLFSWENSAAGYLREIEACLQSKRDLHDCKTKAPIRPPSAIQAAEK